MIDWNAVSAMIAEKLPSKSRKTTSGALSFEDAAFGMTACYQNAEALLSDARLLASGDRSATAIALTILALEELAKIPGLNDTTIRSTIPEDDLRWRRFWKRYYRHGPKSPARHARTIPAGAVPTL